jgi:hypothetical protein
MSNQTPGPTPAQLDRLTEIEAKLLDVACDECDPDGWMNAEKAAEIAAEKEQEAARLWAEGEKVEAKMVSSEAKQIRSGWKGERYWEKKNANQTLALITRIVTYRQRLEEARLGSGKPLEDDDEKMQADIKRAEGVVKKRLALVKKRQ